MVLPRDQINNLVLNSPIGPLPVYRSVIRQNKLLFYVIHVSTIPTVNIAMLSLSLSLSIICLQYTRSYCAQSLISYQTDDRDTSQKWF